MRSLSEKLAKFTGSAARPGKHPWRLLSPAANLMAVLALIALCAAPAPAADDVQYYCNGSSGSACLVFQLDGANLPGGANADTCVGAFIAGKYSCSNSTVGAEGNPIWPADWDALLYPSLTSGTGVPSVPPNPPAGSAYTFSLPWTGGFGSFSGIFTSSLVVSGTSEILKQGSKNTGDISTWVVATQASPPKDAFLAAALATYTGPPNTAYAAHQLFYHAATRLSPNGSTTEGIWLFQQNVEICRSGPNAGTRLCVAGTPTLAHHQNKDLFLFVSYGSGSATVQAAIWQNGALVTTPGAISLCPNPNDDACAVTNAKSPIILGSPDGPQSPGTGFNVSGTGFAGFAGGVVPIMQFQEGGLDLNRIFAGNAPCFSSAMFATVSSGSSPASASLKAFMIGSYNTCAISATKSCAAGTISGGNITYPISGSVENIGGGKVTNLSLTDSFNGNPQSFDTNSLTCACADANCTIAGTNCASVTLQPGSTATYSASITTANNGGPDVITATMAGVGGGSATAKSNTANCPANSLSTMIDVSKDCKPGTTLVSQSGLVAVQVGVSGTVTNSGQAPLDVTIYDCYGATFGVPGAGTCPTVDPNSCTVNGGTLTTVATVSGLAPGASKNYSDTYLPSAVPSGAPFNFSDQVLAVGTCAGTFCTCPTVSNVANQTCPLCPAGP